MNTTETNDGLVTFGKYKGQSVSAMLADANYCEWLLAQPWFAEKFPAIVDLLCLGGGHEEETPVHNALQARFLNDHFVNGFLTTLLKSRECCDSCRNPLEPFDVSFSFEERGYDVIFDLRTKCGCPHPSRDRIGVELKPWVGDDYPSVLRQILRRRDVVRARGGWANDALFIGEFRSRVLNLDGLRKFFKLSNVTVVMLDDVEKELLA